MLVENATLLLAASDFLSEASWDSMTLPTSVLCSFVLSESLFCFRPGLLRSRFCPRRCRRERRSSVNCLVSRDERWQRIFNEARGRRPRDKTVVLAVLTTELIESILFPLPDS